MQLLGEQVHTEIAVLAGGGRSRDADDLAWPALQQQDIAQADVVAGDGNRAGEVVLLTARGTVMPAVRLTDLGDLDALAGLWMG